MKRVTIRELINPLEPYSTKRFVTVRSAQTLGITAFLMTGAVLFQVGMHRSIDPQLSWLLSGNFAALAVLAGVAYRKADTNVGKEVPPPEGDPKP